MIVVRFTSGPVVHDVRTDRPATVIGSGPGVDVPIPNVGLGGRSLRLTRREAEVDLEILGTGRKLTLRVGDAVRVGEAEVALVGLLPQASTAPVVFGGYEDDLPPPSPDKAVSFEVADADKPPARADEPTPAATTTEARAQERPAAARGATAGLPTAELAAAAAEKAAAAKAAAAARAAADKEKKNQNLAPLKFPEPDFSSELVAQLKRSPFFVISVAVHALIFLLLSLLDSTADRKPPIREGPGAIIASMDAEAEELGEHVEDVKDEGLPHLDDPLPDLDPIFEDEEETPQPKPPQVNPFQREMDELEQDEPQPLEIGVMPGLRAAAAKPRQRKPKMPKADLKRVFSKGAAGSSNQLSADIVRAELGRGRGGNAAKLKKLEQKDVLVVDGSFDHIESVLDALQIEYVKVSPWKLSHGKGEDFKSYKIVFWNCGESLTKRRIESIGKRLRKFVNDGGYLFTTDWGVSNVIPFAFEGYLTSTGNRAPLPEMTLPIEVSRAAQDHPLLEGVFLPGVKGKWWLENASFDVRVGRKDKVTVLIESPMLQSTFNRSPVVAATFHHGRGRVLHAMGHYYQEAGNLAGTIAAHRLALNFVLMRLDQDDPKKR